MPSGAKLVIQTFLDVTIVDFQEVRIRDSAEIVTIVEVLYRLVDALDRKKLILDFSKVRFLSSMAVGVLITLRKKAAAIKGTLVICGLRKQLMEVFEIMKIKKLFTFCTTQNEAMKAFGFPISG